MQMLLEILSDGPRELVVVIPGDSESRNLCAQSRAQRSGLMKSGKGYM